MNLGVEPRLSDHAFAGFQRLLFDIAGIHLTPAKKALVAGRLVKRLRHHGIDCFDEYQRLIAQRQDEMRIAIDLLTTNETHFFREMPHFDLLRERILPAHLAGSGTRTFRVWSAAASSGQEAWSVAMVLADVLGESPWDVFGSDISSRVLEQARRALYPIKLADEIPRRYLQAYCLRGVGAQEGSFTVAPELQRRVRFAEINLNASLPAGDMFDLVLLRNVLIYFQPDTKRRVIERIVERLRPGGWLMVGHSESLGLLADGLQPIAPSVYRRR